MKQTQHGFSGELPKVDLADVLQLHGLNRFSGGLSVQQDNMKGTIFFRDGEVVHAEQGENSGSDAIYRMLTWKTGSFSCHPNLETMQHSIRMSMSQLLLECHCRLDEEGTTVTPPPREERTLNKTVRKVMPIPGVNFAVVIDEQGRPLDDGTDSAARLSAQGHYFVSIAQQLGQLFGASDCHSLAISGKAGHCLVFQAQEKALVVAVPGQNEYAPVENAIRKTLIRKQ